VWSRFRRDNVSTASLIFIFFLMIVAVFGGLIAAALLGHGPNDIFFSGVNNDLLPVGTWTHVQKPDGGTTLFILGADGTLGRAKA
jgi:ABC-type antimicrobial peptide transport system permease subunit